jgi:hypothetical protein
MWLLLFALISSCSFIDDDKDNSSAKNIHYKVTFQVEGWQLLKDGQSDYAWMNKDDGRVLISNSFCNEYQNQSLNNLALKTINSLSDGKLTQEKKITFHEREALEVEGEGKVDGVGVHLKLLNTRRNNCYFDFIAITPISVGTKGSEDFKIFLQSVEFK